MKNYFIIIFLIILTNCKKEECLCLTEKGEIIELKKQVNILKSEIISKDAEIEELKKNKKRVIKNMPLRITKK